MLPRDVTLYNNFPRWPLGGSDFCKVLIDDVGLQWFAFESHREEEDENIGFRYFYLMSSYYLTYDSSTRFGFWLFCCPIPYRNAFPGLGWELLFYLVLASPIDLGIDS